MGRRHWKVNMDKDVLNSHVKVLSPEEEEKLQKQDSRGLVSEFSRNKLEVEAGKNWDKFYKRNETRFFKDRHWTTREFEELTGDPKCRRTLLEVGCGVGNFVYPLIEDGVNMFFYVCDFSPRAIQLVKDNPLYNETNVKAFVCDVTKDDLSSTVGQDLVDVISLIFVLSAIHPENFTAVVRNLHKCLSPGGLILFRDYGLYDMAQIRFGPGSKLGENFYVRQDGTRSYYFSIEEVAKLFEKEGFVMRTNEYISRQTINRKEGIDAQRIFVQATIEKP
ncbi:tRNA N(3)-cytidine methyltransferase METTL6 [Oratosquilla oratoria]|uniref:tRNA N(3)-cytidine methyltransferase METTL6 n=1 Tax=Oratosquilla oratoria TaxID=337810 RepID=UPI003F767538